MGPLVTLTFMGALPQVRVALRPYENQIQHKIFSLQSFIDIMMLIFNIGLFMMLLRVAE